MLKDNHFRYLVSLFSLISLPVFSSSAGAISITPPSSLAINSITPNISAGQLVLESATAYAINTNPGGNSSVTSTLTFAPDFGIDVTIPPPADAPPNFLFDLPIDNVQVLQISGFFNPTTPDLDNANFNVTIHEPVGNSLSNGENFTLFLPNLTSTNGYQVTDVGATNSLADNIDSCSASSAPTISPNLISGVVEVSFNPDPTCSANFQSHGSVRVPEPMTILGSVFVLMIGGMFRRHFTSAKKA